jgi:protein-disulfide isomerase
VSKRASQNKAARMVRERMARERRRRRAKWASIIAAAVLVIAGGIGYGVYAAQHQGGFATPPGATDNGTGFTVGSGASTVDIYEDFICPHCKEFEDASGSAVEQLGTQGKARVVYHPIAILDGSSTTNYSTRAAAASACAAAGGKFREYAKALFAQQPSEGSAGLSDDQLVQIGTSIGLSESSFGSCVRDGTYKSWVQHVTDEASASGVTGTPTVKVNGNEVQPTAEAITSVVEARPSSS